MENQVLDSMANREGLFKEIRLRSKGARTASQRRREKHQSALAKKRKETARQGMKRLLGFDRDVKPSNDYGQNDADLIWATGDESWAPDLEKPFNLERPTLEYVHNYRVHRAMAIRRNLFRFGERFRKPDPAEEILPTAHVCGIAEYQSGKDRGIIIVRSLDDDGHSRQKYSFPGGELEEGETPEQAVEREFPEETGLSVEISGPPLFQTYLPKTKHTFICYPVRITGGTPCEGAEIVEMLLMPEKSLREIAEKGLSWNHLKAFRKFEGRQQYLAKLKKLAAEGKKAAGTKARRRYPKQNPLPRWIEVNRYRRPRPLGPDEIKGGPMFNLSAEMAELNKLGFQITVKRCDPQERDRSLLLRSGGEITPEEDGCFLKNGRDEQFFLKVRFPNDLKGTKLVAAVQQGQDGAILKPLWIFPDGEGWGAVSKRISTLEVQAGYTTKFPDNNLLLILVRKGQLQVWRVGIATRIYEISDGGAHHFLVVWKTYQAQLYRDADGKMVTDDQEFRGFNRWPDMQNTVRPMVNPKSLPVFKAKKAKKTATKISEGQARVLWFDILKGFGYAETKDGSRKFHWEQTNSSERLPHFKPGQWVEYKEVFETVNGSQLAGVTAADRR